MWRQRAAPTPREAEERAVALRRLGGKKQEILALEDALNRLAQEAAPPA